MILFYCNQIYSNILKIYVPLLNLIFWVFFFFKQKTAYEIPLRLVGSEMCIRDRVIPGGGNPRDSATENKPP